MLYDSSYYTDLKFTVNFLHPYDKKQHHIKTSFSLLA